MSCRFSRVLSAALALGLCGASAVHAASSFRILDVDLDSKIDAAVTRPEHFAVDIPHLASTQSAGSWERVNGMSTWRYAVRIPSAVSMSFHAGPFKLPGGASLIVTGADGKTFTYSSTDGGRDELWSRLHRGDTLSFELRVVSALESQVDLALTSVQAGYRVLGGGAPDHPHFRKLVTAGTAAAVATCTENFACHSNPANAGNGDATAAIVIGGVALCSATLVNNLRNDATPYLLTARHCQDNPNSGVVVYWDAVTPCGTPLGSVYDTQTPAHIYSTDTVFEQQDVWLIRLSYPPNGIHVYFAGWDATGGTFIGGYSPHHALGASRQYTGWFGQAALQTLSGSVLGVGYDSTYWGVVNSVGNVGSGASGGGLFNAENRLVGIASRADLASGGEGVCPKASPKAPDPSTSTALYSSLAAVWESNADTTSFTNPVTLKSLLDPDNTGARVSDGFEMLAGVYLSSNPYFGETGRTITLSWGSRGATSCMASGGVAGDGWSGSRATSGTYEVTQYDDGLTTYTIRCTDGVRYAIRSVRVTWNLSSPSVGLSPSDSSGIIGASIRMFWRATVVPCTASGGVAGDGWAGPKPGTGPLEVPLLQTGETRYSMVCGTGARTVTQTASVTAFGPVATLTPGSNNMRVNSEVLVMQSAYGANCTRTGGAPGDGWTAVTDSYPLRLTSSAPGTFHYVLTCSGGPGGTTVSAVATMDLTFTNDPPLATLSASPSVAIVAPGVATAESPGTSPYAVVLSWTSNVAPCQLTYDGPGNEDGNVNPSRDLPATGTWSGYGSVIGTYEFRVTCVNGGVTSTATATAQFVAAPPAVAVLLTTPTPAANEPFLLLWSSNTSPCVASGGFAGDGWAGPQNGQAGTGSFTVTMPGNYVYTMTCGTAPNTASDSVTVNIGAPAVAFEPHAAQGLVGRGFILRWAGNVGPCFQTGDWANTASYPANGASVIDSAQTGTRTYGIRCGTTTIVEASTQVTYLPLPTVDITANVSSTNVNQPVTLTWISANASSCSALGSQSSDWSGALPTSGSRVITRSSPGTAGFYIGCDDAIDAVAVEWRSVITSPPAVAGPAVNLTIDHATRKSGEPVTLSWTSTHAATCHGSDGVNGDGWVGALPVSGTRSITAIGAGTFTWSITCDGAPPSATAQVSAVYSAPASSSSGGGSSSSGSSGGGGGGGGRLDLVLLAALAALALASAARVGRRRRME